jgi:hypothetical protein
MIAHGLIAIKNVDHLYVFGAGRIVEELVYKDLSTIDGSKLTHKIAKQSL